MTKTEKNTERKILKLSTIGKAARALAEAAEANGVTPKIASVMIIDLANKQLEIDSSK